jgi:hypothetical protein
LVGLFLTAPVSARAYMGGGVLTGELVVTNAAQNQFRLVGHGGSFIAPAGIPVGALDGKPVEVELSGDGRVLQISQMPIHLEPIVHGFELVSGQLVAADPVTRTFTIAGDNRVYIAPSSFDIRPYAGRMVEVRLDERGQVMDIDFAPRFGGDAPMPTGNCSYNGQGFSDGAPLCQSGTQYRCERGMWRSLGTACVADGRTSLRSLRTCVFGDASVANGSTICRDGRVSRCADGEWVYVGTACS